MKKTRFSREKAPSSKLVRRMLIVGMLLGMIALYLYSRAAIAGRHGDESGTDPVTFVEIGLSGPCVDQGPCMTGGFFPQAGTGPAGCTTTGATSSNTGVGPYGVIAVDGVICSPSGAVCGRTWSDVADVWVCGGTDGGGNCMQAHFPCALDTPSFCRTRRVYTAASNTMVYNCACLPNHAQAYWARAQVWDCINDEFEPFN